MSVHRYAKRRKESLRQAEVSLLSYVVERLGTITTVKVNNQEKNEVSRFNTQTDEMYTIAQTVHFAQGSMMGFIGLATNVSLMSILFVGGNMLAMKEMTPGDLTRFAIQSAFVGLGFSGLSTFYRDMVESLDGAGRVYAVMAANALEQEQVDAMTADATLTLIDSAPDPVPLLSNVIEIRDIKFSYASRPDTLVLNGLNLDVPANSFTCIVGASGVGKSSLFGLLCGLHTMPRGEAKGSSNSGGSIVVNGKDISEESKDWLYKHVSVIFTQP